MQAQSGEFLGSGTSFNLWLSPDDQRVGWRILALGLTFSSGDGLQGHEKEQGLHYSRSLMLLFNAQYARHPELRVSAHRRKNHSIAMALPITHPTLLNGRPSEPQLPLHHFISIYIHSSAGPRTASSSCSCSLLLLTYVDD